MLERFESDQLAKVTIPKDRNLQLIADIFGYKKTVHELNSGDSLNNETSNYISVQNDTIIVEFPLHRLTKGNIVTMYNVFFYRDAAIMKSTSIFQLDELVAMLKENPNYSIMIHGHTNGNYYGKYTVVAEGEDLFSRSPSNETKMGSATTLSEERAAIIKRYLIEHGISEDRMKVKGWGGKSMLYAKNDKDAIKNVRVEVEILED